MAVVHTSFLRPLLQVAVITLNNPATLNALTEPMGEALIAKVEEVKKLQDVRATIVTGMGYPQCI